MKALVYMGASKLEYKEYKETGLAEDEVAIKVLATGICGSDLHAFLGHDARRVPPLVLGHEILGEVLSGADKGLKVAINPIISCGRCTFCLLGKDNLCSNRKMLGMNKPGGFAEYININKKNVIPMNLLGTTGVLSEPVATALHSIRLLEKVSSLRPDKMRVLVIGAGSVGLLCGILLKDFGCNNITILEKNEKRLKNVEAIDGIRALSDELASKEKFDTIIDAVGIEHTRVASIKHIEEGGVIIHIGLGNSEGTIDFRKITLSEITFVGTYAYTSKDFIDATKILASKRIENDLNWVEIRNLKDGQKAFEDILDGNVSSAKIVLTN